MGRPWLEVVDTPSADPHRVSRCSFLLGIATAEFSLVPQVVSRGKSVGIQGRFYGRNHWRREGCEGGGGTRARVRRWQKETRVGLCPRTSVEAAAASPKESGVLRTGGLWEEAGRSPKWNRISSMTSGWSMICNYVRLIHSRAYPERALSHELTFGQVTFGPSLPTTISMWPTFPPDTSKNSRS